MDFGADFGAKLLPHFMDFGSKNRSGSESATFDFEQHSHRFACFSILRGSRSVNKTNRKAIENQSPDFNDFGGHLGLSGGTFWEHFGNPGMSFFCVFLGVFFGRPQGRPQIAKGASQESLTPIDPRKARTISVGWAPGGGGQP